MKQPRRAIYKRKWFIITASIVAFVLLVALAFRVSPWPGALVIRTVFNRGGGETLAKLEQALPDYPVNVLRDEVYRPDDKAAKLDVYVPQSAKPEQPLPVVIWTHGGAWLSGDKKDAGPYFSRMANEGFVVVAPNYTLAPSKPFPYAIQQLSDAHAYVVANAERFNADPNRIMLSGDSAGANLSAQLAAMITNPAYAAEVGVQPALKPEQLRAVLLFCGIYKMEGLAHPDPTLPKIVGWGDDVAVWAYSGERHASDEALRPMSPFYYVTSEFPTTFITGGNADLLTDAQSVPMANELTSLGVDVTRLFYPVDHTPDLPHEYQFTFNEDGELAFEKTIEFLRAQTQQR